MRHLRSIIPIALLAGASLKMVTCPENSIEEEEHAFLQLQEELKNVGSSIDTLNTNLEQLALEMQEFEHKSNCNAKCSKLQAEQRGYEHCFLELYVHIQEKLRQTRELYVTFNAMLEIKDLMLKETSMLNSISSQAMDKHKDKQTKDENIMQSEVISSQIVKQTHTGLLHKF
ncbi:hypothetical protein LOK49_LG13G02479 [Camellia lanceoleosa]|uniref:Uncharacterized protein n=1 Tax=Camellia lanceoleosa TaxID=1840588 RepID=A0ACC0FEB1_9ERIC|nr:hypothetical protein LOK49_LG13G02479 [Camellia lanceoleosa]